MPLDVAAVRARFPALGDDWALMDNAGGSVAPHHVIERVSDYMRTGMVQVGASYPASELAAQRVAAGQRAAADLLRADPSEVILGASTTQNVRLLAAAFAESLKPGDQVIVTDLDHESNIGAWRKLARHGIDVSEWTFREGDAQLHFTDLEPLLSDRTKLVCFTHCSNVVGVVHDVAAVCSELRERGIQSCVDGVAFAPHRRVDVSAIGADYYLVSGYKVFGPHIGLMWGRRERLRRLPGQNHFFIDEDRVPYKFTPGNVNHELTASLVGIVEYLATVSDAQSDAPGAVHVERAFERIREREAAMTRRIVARIAELPRLHLIGDADADRVPTVAFTAEGRSSRSVVEALEKRRLALRFGHFYAKRAVDRFALPSDDGIVRASLVHYNSDAEVDRLLEALGTL